jgi:hypothetical protein
VELYVTDCVNNLREEFYNTVCWKVSNNLRDKALLLNVKKKTSKFADRWKRQREERRHVGYWFGEWGG